MIAPELRQRDGFHERPQAEPVSSGGCCGVESNSISAAFSAVRSAIGGARGNVPVAVLITAAAVAGITAGWLVKRR